MTCRTNRMRTAMLVVAALGLALSAGAPAFAEDVLIRAAKVYTNDGPPLSPGAVLVSNGKVSKVGRELKAPTGAKVIDLGKGTLLPGFVDAYRHAAISNGEAEQTREITPGFRVLTAIDWRSRAFKEARSEGVTTIGLFPGTDGVVSGLACAAKTTGADRVLLKEAGLAITVASDPASGNAARSRPDSIYVRQPTNRMGVIWMLRSTFDKAGRQSDAELSVIGEALAGKRKIFAVSRTEHDLTSLLRLAKEFKFSPIIVGGQESYKLRADLAAAKIPVILGPVTTSAAGTGPEATDIVWNQPALLHSSGIPFALSGGRLLEQAQFAIRHGLPEEAAIRAITLTPARLLGLESRLGSLAPGKDANMVALDGDLADLSASVQWVALDGILYEKDK